LTTAAVGRNLEVVEIYACIIHSNFMLDKILDSFITFSSQANKEPLTHLNKF